MTSPLTALCYQLDQLVEPEDHLPWSCQSDDLDDDTARIVDSARLEISEDLGSHDAALIVAAVNALPQLTAAIRAVDELANSLDVDSCDPMPDDRSRLLLDTAQRIRAALATVADS